MKSNDAPSTFAVRLRKTIQRLKRTYKCPKCGATLVIYYTKAFCPYPLFTTKKHVVYDVSYNRNAACGNKQKLLEYLETHLKNDIRDDFFKFMKGK